MCQFCGAGEPVGFVNLILALPEHEAEGLTTEVAWKVNEGRRTGVWTTVELHPAHIAKLIKVELVVDEDDAAPPRTPPGWCRPSVLLAVLIASLAMTWVVTFFWLRVGVSAALVLGGYFGLAVLNGWRDASRTVTRKGDSPTMP